MDSDQEENVTRLISKPVEKFIKTSRYKSNHSTRIRCEIKEQKNNHRTFGLATYPLKPPSEFLKKNGRIVPQRPIVKHVHYRRPGFVAQLPKWTPLKIKPIPEVADLPKDPTKTARINFRKQNFLDVKNSQPRKPKPRYVDTCSGDVHDLIPSGLVPVYIYKKNFGKAPSFVMQMIKKAPSISKNKNEDVTRPVSKLPNVTAKASKKPPCRYVSEEEREQLLKGMQNRWDELMKHFQCLPFLTDTPPKIKRKSNMEKQLCQLEKDIDIIKRHPYIYVYDV